jgi:hypothetical protein
MNNDSTNNPNSKEFKQLQQSWYKILADSGFKDIEVDPTTMKQRHLNSPRDHADCIGLAKGGEEWVRLLGLYAHDTDYHKTLKDPYSPDHETFRLYCLLLSEGKTLAEMHKAGVSQWKQNQLRKKIKEAIKTYAQWLALQEE